jgi:putative spermidine/putrescine transport system substrate-binding protein
MNFDKRRMFSAAGMALLAGLCLPGPASAQEAITVTSFGGAFEDAADNAWYKPFTEETGIQINKEQYDGGLAKLRAMVEAGNTTWDVLDLESNDAIAGCDEGLLQPLDPELLGGAEDFIEGAVLPCAVASMVWATVYAYDTTKLETAPTTMADFFDTEKFPGKRGLRKGPKGTLEWALIADGVPVGEVYQVLGTPEGVDRAFAKLDTIKDDIVWWEAGSQPPQLLADGAVVMTQAYNGRIYDAVKDENKPFEIVWDGQLYDYEWWGIPTGTEHKEAAEKFISAASQADRIGQLSNFIAYAPPRKSAIPKVNAEILPHLPTAPDNFGNALQIDAEFWADNFDELNNRFTTWLGQ